MPFSFRGIKSDSRDRCRPIVVPTESTFLQSGDYSIVGMDSRVAIERKSKSDLYGTLSRERARFERELVRLQQMEFAAVVVECSLSALLAHPPPMSKARPKSISRSVIAYQQRYARVHWVFAPDRRFAEIWTFRALQRFWLDRQPGGFFNHGANSQTDGE